MLFFRSEELVLEWCAAQRAEVGPLVNMSQLWGLATAWYGGRLEPDSKRPRPDEMRTIFAGLGLEGDFWDPTADRFR